MATHKETTEFILDSLKNHKDFHVRAMFGEYALYVGEKVVGLICDDQLYIKILPAGALLEELCEKGEPYPGAKLLYLVSEDTLTTLEELPDILIAIADSLPAKKPKKPKQT